MRESTVERYLHQQVIKAGGTTRKWVSPGHKGVPDRIVIWSRGVGGPSIHFIECKARGGVLRANQVREHARLREFGCRVEVLWDKQQVDIYVSAWR